MTVPGSDRVEYVAPDREFVKQAMKMGGPSLKKCMQCGTCSVVCPLSPDERPFPRKEMIWTAWGLKDRLVNDPDVWLCHRCEDCSNYCPRGSNPGDVMATIRNLSISHFAFPGFLAKANLEAKYFPLLLLFPTIVIIAALMIGGRFVDPGGEIIFAHFIPVLWLQIGALVFLGPVIVFALISFVRFWRSGSAYWEQGLPTSNGAGDSRSPAAATRQSLGGSLVSTAVDILKHTNFKQCVTNSLNYVAHFAILYGFLLLIIATAGRTVYQDFLGKEEGLPFTDPVKMSGNLGGLLVLIGCALVVYVRLAKGKSFGRGTFYEWSFIFVLVLTVLSGFVTQTARFGGTAMMAYWAYVVHLIFVFALLVYAPYSKFAHAAYRAIAMIRAKQIGRSWVRGKEAEKAAEPAKAPAIERA